MTEYVVTTGNGSREIYRCGTLFGAIAYAEAYAGQHRKSVSVCTDDEQSIFAVEVVDGQFFETDLETQQAEWEEFIEEEGG